jgi:hypothetical protein
MRIAGNSEWPAEDIDLADRTDLRCFASADGVRSQAAKPARQHQRSRFGNSIFQVITSQIARRNPARMMLKTTQSSASYFTILK